MNRKLLTVRLAPILAPVLIGGLIGATAMPSPALAHHSFAMFDQTKEVELKDATVVDRQ